MENAASPESLRALLASHPPSDAKEAADLQTMKVYAERLSAPFSRDQPEAHFTGSAVVVDERGERVCLVHHLKLGRWLQPGGHCEPQDGGELWRTAVREAREETGLDVVLHPGAPRPLDVDCHPIPGRQGSPGHAHLDVRFLVQARTTEGLAHDPQESHGAEWMEWDEALRRAGGEPALIRLLEKARRCAAPALA